MQRELRIQNLICGGNFPRTRKAGAQDVVSRSVPDTVLRMMDMAGHATVIYCLQVYLEGKKEVNEI